MENLTPENDSCLSFNDWLKSLSTNDAENTERLLNEVKLNKKIYNRLSTLTTRVVIKCFFNKLEIYHCAALLAALTESNELLRLTFCRDNSLASGEITLHLFVNSRLQTLEVNENTSTDELQLQLLNLLSKVQ